MKTILASILAGAFLMSVPSIVRADDKPVAAKSGKKDKKADKGDKADKGKKDEGAKAGGGW